MAASSPAAIASPIGERGTGASLRLARGFAISSVLALAIAGAEAKGASNKVRITALGDVTFGTLADFGTDAVQSQGVCLFADTVNSGYNVTARGAGPSGAFQLASGANPLPFEVQWSSSASQTSGTQMSPNVPLTGLTSTATHQACANGPAASASLIIVLRSAAISGATAGNYTGSLTLVVGPE